MVNPNSCLLVCCRQIFKADSVDGSALETKSKMWKLGFTLNASFVNFVKNAFKASFLSLEYSKIASYATFLCS